MHFSSRTEGNSSTWYPNSRAVHNRYIKILSPLRPWENNGQRLGIVIQAFRKTVRDTLLIHPVSDLYLSSQRDWGEAASQEVAAAYRRREMMSMVSKYRH